MRVQWVALLEQTTNLVLPIGLDILQLFLAPLVSIREFFGEVGVLLKELLNGTSLAPELHALIISILQSRQYLAINVEPSSLLMHV